jgi:microcystin degradation protein MlrC
MPIAIASIMQESNTFSPVATRYEDFSPVFGRAVLDRHRGKLTEMGGFISALEERGIRIRPVCAAWAITAGRMLRRDFDRLVHEFLEQLRHAGRIDGLLLALHGAHTAQGIDDAEGHILEQARDLLGPKIPIVITLDLHANVTRRMAEACNGIFGYRTYPHIDMFESGSRAAAFCLNILDGTIDPVVEFRKLPMIVPAENMQTTGGPMHRLQTRARRIESKGQAHAVSIFGVQPWLDIEEMGCSVVAVGSRGQARTARAACDLARQFWDIRREFDVKLVPVKTAIRRAIKTDGGPVVLSESSDSTGSGSPGDSTGVLKELLRAKLNGPAAIFVVDPEAVATAMEVGVGSTVTMNLGGCLDRRNSQPVLVTARVRMLSDGRWTPSARGYNPGIEQSMGRATVLEAGQVRILVGERSTMTVDPELFRSHGIDPAQMKIVVVKSPAGFRAAYGPIAKDMMVVDTPGVSTANLKTLPWRRVPRPIYPLDPRTRLGKDF